MSRRPLAARAAAFLAAATPLLAWPARALAHPGRALAPHDAWTAWTLEPAEVPLLALSALLYARGVRALWRRAGRGAGVRRWEAACFGAGWVALALALVSPIHAMGAVLFSAHMAQHELLMALAAPLLVLGRPVVAGLWALPTSWRRRVGAVARWRRARGAWHVVAGIGVASVIHGVGVWAWHAPALYQWTLRSDLAHAAQHATFVGTALLFWWAILAPRARRSRAGAGVLALFLTTLHTGALGALLALASRPWYPAYIRTTSAWGLTALEDQQLAGLVMWVPASLAYVAAALWILGSCLTDRGAGLPAFENRVTALGKSG